MATAGGNRAAAGERARPPLRLAERLAERLIGAAWPAAVALAVVGGALWRDAAPLASVILASAAGLTLLGVWDRVRAQRLAARVLQDRPGSATGAVARLVERLAALDHRTAQLHPVTGLPTREPFCEAIARDVAERGTPRLMGLLRFADFDRLAGFDLAFAEEALAQFAGRLGAAVKSGHALGQIDRDCVAIWFSGSEMAEAFGELRALTHVARQEICGSEAVLSPTVEVSAVSYPRDGAEGGRLILKATAALSRGGLESHRAPLSAEAAREQFMLEQDLAQAIAEDQLAMVFQPVVDLAAGRVVGAEALMRWNHPKLGPVSPARFIPVVEALGLSDRYGLWALNTACREASRWREAGAQGLKVAVNLSARQLLDPHLSAKVERTLARHGLPPQALELELTETAAMADGERTVRLFSTLRDLGVSLAIDDFGSGYSSLSYLKNLPFDKLKIDREFVTQADRRRDSRAICRALIELGRGLDLQVLAEGVETPEEVAALQALGCHIFQGYRFSRPLPAEEFCRLAADPDWPRRLVGAASDPNLTAKELSA
ncbi:bifunctional diguanylate cyclase/phosphodiesterase [Phenylobacterium sp.]|uniref:putative bifunctional diguanylate cyclase/phosphodiesterase n=1 Tax=Phenylobacterium sp. TaxID=1871053 RepID=UPI0025D21199|nr:bifunctional diguanylate cyclase/phosphodiesterase [Phenylobacterium sp.]